MTLSEIADVVGGEVDGAPDGGRSTVVDAPASLDSRAVPAGGIFVAIRGERADGHDYAEAAVAGGAAAVLGSRPTGVPTVVVDDPGAALAALATHVRGRLSATVLAVTGSQGKTGTKDYLAQVLAVDGPTVATAGNFNNELGVPLTVLRADEWTRYLVVEMGARGVGHIDFLCGIARPHHGAVLNVGSAHASEFGSVEVTARAKGELLAALPAEGTAVVNVADPRTQVGLAGAAVQRVLGFTPAPRDGVPATPTGDARPEQVLTWHEVGYDDLGRPHGTLGWGEERRQVALRQIGTHQLDNAAAAGALALAAGLDLGLVATALSDAVGLSRWRMELHERADGLVVLNDAYNANPESMRAALDTLAGIGRRSGRRTVAVVGEMRELGAGHDAQHAAVGEAAARLGVDVVLVVGDVAATVLGGAAKVTSWGGLAVSAGDRGEALAWLRENVRVDDVVLVKASRAAGLEEIGLSLSEENPA